MWGGAPNETSTNHKSNQRTINNAYKRATKGTKCKYGRHNSDRWCAIQVLGSSRNTTAQQKIGQIQTPEILEDRERHQCAERAYTPDTATIRMLKNDIILQYTGVRQYEDRWNPPGLQTQPIVLTHDNIQYELHSEIRYAKTRYIYRNQN